MLRKKRATVHFLICATLFCLAFNGCRPKLPTVKAGTLSLEEAEKTIAQLSDTISKGATNPKIYLECGKAYLQKFQRLSRRQADFSWNAFEFLEKGTSVLSKGLELDSASSELLYYHGLSLIDLNGYIPWGTWSEAISNLEKAASLAPKSGFILTGLARAYLGRSGLDRTVFYQDLYRPRLNTWFVRAQATLEMSMQLDPSNSKAYRYLGNLHYIQGHYRKAFEEYDQAIKLGPSDPEDYERLSYRYMDSGIRTFWEEIGWIPSFIKIPFLLPAILFVSPERQMDMKLLQRAIALDSNFALPLREIAVSLMQNGQIESAALYYLRFRRIDQTSSSNLLTAASNVNYPCEKLFQTAIQNDPEYYVPYLDLGNYYRDFASPPDPDKAVVQFRKAIQLNPHVGSPYSALGSIYLKKGDSAKAREYFLLAIRTNDSTAWRDVFDEYVDIGQLEEASRLLETSTKTTLRKSYAYVSIADKYLFKGDTKSAEKYYLKSLAESNRNDWAEEGMGKLSARISNKEYASLVGCEIRAEDKYCIGVVTPDTSNPGSFLKTNFRLDSQDTLVSRYNSLSEYGGLDGSMSPFNQRCTKPPRIMRGGSFVSYLTDNPNITPRISASRLVGFLGELSRMRDSKDSSKDKR